MQHAILYLVIFCHKYAMLCNNFLVLFLFFIFLILLELMSASQVPFILL